MASHAGSSPRAGPRGADDPFAWTPARLGGAGARPGEREPLRAAGAPRGDRRGRQRVRGGEPEALALAEQRLADLPGVTAVFGPAGLLDVSVDGAGAPRARMVLARGGSESDGEAARQQVVRRADALGWFLTENGQRVRFLIDAPDWARVAPGVAAALTQSGLSLAPSETIGVRPLWPDPRGRWRWLPVLLSVAAVTLALGAMGRIAPPLARRGPRRRLAVALAAAAGAAAPFAFVPVAGVRLLGALAALGAALVVLGAPPWRARLGAPLVLRSRLAAVPVVVALVVIVAGGFLLPRLRVATRQWSAAPLFFVSVRADIDEPVVMRELRRLTDYLRAQPGVTNAWSIADLFMGVTFEGGEAARIPDEAERCGGSWCKPGPIPRSARAFRRSP